MATLTIRGIDAAGATAFSGSVAVDDVDDLQRFASMQSFGETGEVSFSVPVGHYSIATEIATVKSDGTIESQALIFQPEVEVTETGATLEMDARTATTLVPVPKTPKESTFEQMGVTFGRECATGLVSSISYITLGGEPNTYVTPTSPVTLGEVHRYTYFRMNGPSGTEDPYLYETGSPSFPQRTSCPVNSPPR